MYEEGQKKKKKKSDWAFVDVRDELDLFSPENAAPFINPAGPDQRSDNQLLQPSVGVSPYNSFVFCHLLRMKNGDNISS